MKEWLPHGDAGLKQRHTHTHTHEFPNDNETKFLSSLGKNSPSGDSLLFLKDQTVRQTDGRRVKSNVATHTLRSFLNWIFLSHRWWWWRGLLPPTPYTRAQLKQKSSTTTHQTNSNTKKKKMKRITRSSLSNELTRRGGGALQKNGWISVNC